MNRERWLEVAEDLSRAQGPHGAESTLCDRCRAILGVTGVVISVMTILNAAPICASDAVSASLEDLQFTLGEGPTYEAFKLGSPILDEELDDGFPRRWPALVALAAELRIKGIFAFPLQLGAARVGVLTAYQVESRAWTSRQDVDAVILADVLTHLMLASQAEVGSGSLADLLRDAGAYRAEVHQAAGMLSAQVEIPVAEALIRLRGHSFATGRPIADLAAAVTARRLRLNRSDILDLSWSED